MKNTKFLSLEEKVNYCLNERFENLHDNLKKELFEFLVDQCDQLDTVSYIIEQIRRKCKFPELGRGTSHYWLARGWNEAESKSKEFLKTKPKRTSPFSIEFWLDKINLITGVEYTKDEANYKRNSQRPIRKEYWIELGYPEDEAIELAKETKNFNNKKGAGKNKDRDKTYFKYSSPRCLGYYLMRGHTEEESKNLLKDTQTTFSLEKCIQRYGKGEGFLVWKARQEKWQGTLNSKPQEEIDLINQKKNVFNINSYILRGFSEEVAQQLHADYLKKLSPRFSMESINFFEKNKILSSESNKSNVFFGEHEFFLYDKNKKISFYDLTFLDKKLIVEYHGEKFHPNKKVLSEEEFSNWCHAYSKESAENVYNRDQYKKQLAISNGFIFIEIYSNDPVENVNKIKTIIFGDVCK